MKISTKGRYALRVLVDLAGYDRHEYVALKDIAEKQSISTIILRFSLPAAL